MNNDVLMFLKILYQKNKNLKLWVQFIENEIVSFSSSNLLTHT